MTHLIEQPPFEELQSIHPTSGSSFEPADLPSNMIAFYRVVEGLEENAIRDIIKPLTPEQSLEVYRSYPGTFTSNHYKNRSFHPRFFETPYTSANFGVPAQLNTIRPALMGSLNDFGLAIVIPLEGDLIRKRNW